MTPFDEINVAVIDSPFTSLHGNKSFNLLLGF